MNDTVKKTIPVLFIAYVLSENIVIYSKLSAGLFSLLMTSTEVISAVFIIYCISFFLIISSKMEKMSLILLFVACLMFFDRIIIAIAFL